MTTRESQRVDCTRALHGLEPALVMVVLARFKEAPVDYIDPLDSFLFIFWTLFGLKHCVESLQL